MINATCRPTEGVPVAKRIWGVAIAAAMLAGTVGCGADAGDENVAPPAGDAGASDSAAPDGPGRPCELLTGADAAPLLGVATLTPTEDTDEDCVYQNGVDLVQLTIA